MSSALPKPLKDSLATRPEIQITHTRGGRQSLAPVDINTLGPDLKGPTLAKANLQALFSLTNRSSNWRNLIEKCQISSFKTKYGIVTVCSFEKACLHCSDAKSMV